MYGLIYSFILSFYQCFSFTIYSGKFLHLSMLFIYQVLSNLSLFQGHGLYIHFILAISTFFDQIHHHERALSYCTT
jgi:hypothetical protein